MKSKMKRIITLLLSLVLLFSVCGVYASADKSSLDLFAEVSEDAEQMMENQSDFLDGISEGFSEFAKNLEKADKLKTSVDFFGTFMKGAQTVSLALGLVNGTVSFLKLVGILEDPTASMLNTIYDCLLDIQKTVQTIDKRTDDIQKSLVAQASTSTYQFRLDRYDSYQQSWNAFFNASGSYDEMRRLTEAYQSEFNKKMMDYVAAWQDGNENGIRVLYAKESLALASGTNLAGGGAALPKQPSYSDDGFRVASSVVLPGSYIAIEDALVNGETYLPLLEAAVRKGTEKALQDQALIASDEAFYENYEKLNEEQKSVFSDRLVKDFLDAVAYDASYETANMTYGVGTFASAVKSAYTMFSDTVLGKQGVTSPLESGLTKLSLTHAFEGEVKTEAAAICAYLSEISLVYGEFASFMVSMDRGMSQSQKTALIDLCLKTTYYPICYHESFITGYDNYCYPLNALIEYNEAHVNGSYNYKNSYEPKQGGWEIFGTTFVSETDEVRSILDNHLLISKEDMALLYLYCESAMTSNPEISDFIGFLGLADLLPSFPSYVFVGGPPPEDLKLEFSPLFLMSNPTPVDLMKRKVAEYRTKDKVWGESVMFYKSDSVHFKQGEMNYSSQAESTVFFHDQMKADIFDASSAGLKLDSRLKNEYTIAEKAYTYYVLDKSFGAGKYVYVTFVNPGAELSYFYKNGGTSTLMLIGQNYSMLSYSTEQIRGNDPTASVFGSGTWWIICGGAVLLSAAAVTTVCVVKKKNKKKAAAPDAE